MWATLPPCPMGLGAPGPFWATELLGRGGGGASPSLTLDLTFSCPSDRAPNHLAAEEHRARMRITKSDKNRCY